jgi:folate-binding protein YgfZ
VFVFSDRGVLTIDGVAGQTERIITHLDRYIIREDVALRDRAQDGQVWLLGGARAQGLLKDLADGDVPARPLCLAACEILRSRVSLRRVPILTGPAFVIACSGGDAARIEEAFTNAGVVRCEPAVGEIVRVEAGFPRYGQDISDDNLPQEVGRDAQAINFTKGCYLGQETVARLDALGHVNRLLCGLRWDAAGPPAADAPLVVDQRIVGRITSSVWSPRIQAPLSLAYIRREHARVGTRLQTEFGMAEVARLPLTEVGDQV